jgi:shikimate dehydrogenase
VTRRCAGVLGRPVEHSLSPVLHRAAYTALGLDWTYTAIDCGIDELPATLAARQDWAGFSATMPLKHAALEVATSVSPLAAAVGAANTLLPGPQGWIADNTDVAGLVETLRPHLVPGAPACTVIGGGGTAQAAVAALAQLAMPTCTVVVREPARAAPVVATAARLGIGVAVQRLDADPDALAAQVVVSTLPPGAADPLAAHGWRAGQVLLDVVYAGWPTPLAAAAADAGATVLSGAAMLLYQAAAQVRLMTGRAAPVAQMRAALLAAAPNSGL